MSETPSIPSLDQIAQESNDHTTPLLTNYPKNGHQWIGRGYYENGRFVIQLTPTTNIRKLWFVIVLIVALSVFLALGLYAIYIIFI